LLGLQAKLTSQKTKNKSILYKEGLERRKNRAKYIIKFFFCNEMGKKIK